MYRVTKVTHVTSSRLSSLVGTANTRNVGRSEGARRVPRSSANTHSVQRMDQRHDHEVVTYTLLSKDRMSIPLPPVYTPPPSSTPVLRLGLVFRSGAGVLPPSVPGCRRFVGLLWPWRFIGSCSRQHRLSPRPHTRHASRRCILTRAHPRRPHG